jgi:hypothetical protein
MIVAGGVFQPPQIAVPAHLAIQFTVVSKDGHAHHVVLKTSPAHALSVPANGRASVRIPGPKAGRYVVELDGTARALLVTGAQPGP